MFTSSFFNAQLVGEEYDKVYSAEDLAKRFALFFTNGVFYNSSNALQVRATNGLHVEIQIGACNIDGYCGINDSSYDLILSPANALMQRYDAICVRLDHTNRTMLPVVVEGVPAENPSYPELKNDSTAKDICLAYVRVSAGAEQLYNADITDTRLNTTLCGIVTQAVQTIDTTTLYQQFESSLNKFLESSEVEFSTWFETMKETLSSISIGDLTNRIIALEEFNAKENKYFYFAKGVNDSASLSSIVNSFLNENLTDENSLKIFVQGNNFATGTPTVYENENFDFVFFGLGSNRKVEIDFSNCNKIISTNGLGIKASSNVKIIGLRFETSGNVAIDSSGLRIERSSITGRQFGITGTHVYATDCKIEATGLDGVNICAGVYCGGSLFNCDVVAQSNSNIGLGAGSGAFGVRLKDIAQPLFISGGSYRGYVRSGATTSEGIGIYIPSGIQNATLNVVGARCPQVARSGFVQTQSIKLNIGYGSVYGCPCYAEPLIYSTLNFMSGGNALVNITTGLK